MKRNTLNGKTALVNTIRISCAIAAGITAPQAMAEDEAVEFTNSIAVEIGGVDVGGSDAAFMRRWGSNGDFFGGIRSLAYEREIGNGLFEMDGHAMFGLNDYDLNLKYSIDDIGYVAAGYREFRTWYDGNAGYFPSVPPGWFPPANDELELDRGELWFEAGLRMPDIPEITLRYSHLWRDGQKDSTVWGGVFPDGTQRGIMPGLNDIDETRDRVTLDVTHTLGNTDLGLSLRYEGVRNDNTRSTNSINAAGTTTTRLTQRDVYEYDLFGGRITSESRFGERMMLSFGYSLTTMDTNVDGSQRGDTNLTTSVFSPTYNLLNGSGDFVQNVANLNFWWNPIDDLTVVPSIRASWEEIEMLASRFNTVAATQSGIPTVTNRNDNDVMDLNEALEIRYTGFTDLVLYTRGEWMQGDGTRWLRRAPNDYRYTSTDVDEAKYTIGANWYPVSGLSISAQAYHRTFDEDFGHQIMGTAYDAQMRGHSWETNDVNLRVTWRALPCLTFVTRYDYQRSAIENQSYTDALATVATLNTTSGIIRQHVISQSATWNATDSLYLQGSVHYVNASTSTPADTYQPGYHKNWDNDYISGSLSAGFAVNKNTDVRATYHYYGSNSYSANTLTVPYGAVAEEHAFTVALTQWVTPAMAWNVRYGFFKGKDDGMGGNGDFDAHMLSSGLQFRF
jgi:hypothetical protein